MSDQLTVKQAAAQLQTGPQTIRRYVKAGLLEASQLVPNGKLLISAASVARRLEATKVGAK